VVRELVAAQSGSVSVHDAPGGGASFVVTLPQASAGSVKATPTHALDASYSSNATTRAHSLMQ
jgi:hypothetical protein